MSKRATTRSEFLDLLRAIAIVLVIIHHYRHFTGAPDWFVSFGLRGYLGVDVFFVLSGWLIGGQAFRELDRSGSIHLRRFWMRRWMRTLPVYYVFLAIHLVLTPKARDASLSLMLFAQNYLDPNAWLISWSLCVEEHFYVALPLVLLLLSKVFSKKPKLLVALFSIGLCSVLLRYLVHPEVVHLTYRKFLTSFYSVTHFRLDGLLFGVAFAGMSHWKTKLWLTIKERPKLFGIIGLLVACLAGWGPFGGGGEEVQRMTLYNSVFQHFVFSLGIALIIGSGLELERKGVCLSIPGATFLSHYAFTLYLAHIIPVKYVKTMDYPFVVLVAISLASSIVIAFSIREGVEKPFLKIRDKLLGKYFPVATVN